MTNKQALLSSLLVAFLFIGHSLGATLSHSTAASPTKAPAPTAQAPSPPNASTTATAASAGPPLSDIPIVQAPPHKGRSRIPTNVTHILEKVGGFSVFMRLLKSTEVLTQVENQLSASNSLTILAPTNDGFAATLKPGTLNALTNEQKVQLIQYHVLPTFISLDKFETLSNPVRTQASSTYDYPMNITAEGNWVNISTGLVNASLSATVFADGQLAIYRVDKVLLPLGVFAPRPKLPAAPAPAPGAKPKGANPTASGSAASDGADAEQSASGAAGGVVRGAGLASAGLAIMVVSGFVLG